MLRRNFFKLITLAGGLMSPEFIPPQLKTKSKEVNFSLTDHIVSMYLEGVTEFTRIIQISDTHLWMDDDRGIDYQKFSHRMAKAYNKTKHFLTGAETNPAECFEQTLNIAKENKADLIVLTGDIFSFPSEAAIDWVIKCLKETNIPFVFTSGNHDWHYEGMEGSIDDLRITWISKRLSALFPSAQYLHGVYDLNGLKIITIDNSTYQVNKVQRDFFRKEGGSGSPVLLMQHIPMYAKGRNLGFGCGHPDWSGKTDTGFELEKRERWPMEGHNKDTLGYYKDVFSSNNVKGVFAGHTHQQSLDIINGIPQFVTDANANGAYLQIDIFPD
ncbi:MAG: hypothetical protein RIR48_700 [Bacteroidota bacterium]